MKDLFVSSKKLRINLNVPLKAVEQKEIEEVNQAIDEDRKMVIQAAIIRIMKARQTLKHELLMEEVIQQLSSRFQPKIPVIKVELYLFIIFIRYHHLYSRNVLKS
jgi:cullin 1